MRPDSSFAHTRTRPKDMDQCTTVIQSLHVHVSARYMYNNQHASSILTGQGDRRRNSNPNFPRGSTRARTQRRHFHHRQQQPTVDVGVEAVPHVLVAHSFPSGVRRTDGDRLFESVLLQSVSVCTLNRRKLLVKTIHKYNELTASDEPSMVPEQRRKC